MLTNDFSSSNVIRVKGNDIDSEMNFLSQLSALLTSSSL